MKHHRTRAEANQANAQLSTGPKTEEGKRITSHNALKTGLTGRTVLLPTDDADAFADHMARVDARYTPATDDERQLAENIGHLEWRLLRIPSLETGILAVGREEFADAYPDKPLHVRGTMIEAKVHLAYGKQLANLALQESRLTRQHEKQVAKLQALIEKRRAEHAHLLHELCNIYRDKLEEKKPFIMSVFQSFGFEFSYDELKQAYFEREARRLYPAAPTVAAKQLFVTHELDNLLFEVPEEEETAEPVDTPNAEIPDVPTLANASGFDINKEMHRILDHLEEEGAIDPEFNDPDTFRENLERAKRGLKPILRLR